MNRPDTKTRLDSFTLIELLVVISIIGILAALLMPTLAAAKERAKAAQCISNERQIGYGMKVFSDDNDGLYPESGGAIPWDQFDDATNGTHKQGWMQQIDPIVQNPNVYHCPKDRLSPYSYFNGVRAARAASSGGPDGTNFVAVDTKRIQFPAAYVLSGDAPWVGGIDITNDADKDDYSYNCVGGPVNGTPIKEWQSHSKGQNILFDDGHAKWYQGYDTNEMTFRYDSIHGWQ
jgi:prepilin-type N-terminal cleavage/methylation domain-containing protein